MYLATVPSNILTLKSFFIMGEKVLGVNDYCVKAVTSSSTYPTQRYCFYPNPAISFRENRRNRNKVYYIIALSLKRLVFPTGREVHSRNLAFSFSYNTKTGKNNSYIIILSRIHTYICNPKIIGTEKLLNARLNVLRICLLTYPRTQNSRMTELFCKDTEVRLKIPNP